MSTRSKRLIAGEVVVLVIACVVAAITSTAADWEPIELFAVLLVLAVGSDFLALQHKVQRISGSFLAIVLAMALLGPAPAVVIAVLSVLVDQLRAKNPLPRFITNLATWATFPLVGGLLIQAAAGWLDVQENELAFSLLVLGGFLVAILLNFLGIAGDYVFHSRGSLAHEFRTIFLPVLPSELVSALLCVLVAFVYFPQRLCRAVTARAGARHVPVPAARAADLAQPGGAAGSAADRGADLDDRDTRAAGSDDRATLGGGGAVRACDGGRDEASA